LDNGGFEISLELWGERLGSEEVMSGLEEFESQINKMN
jgi:hypothetical protein